MEFKYGTLGSGAGAQLGKTRELSHLGSRRRGMSHAWSHQLLEVISLWTGGRIHKGNPARYKPLRVILRVALGTYRNILPDAQPATHEDNVPSC